MTEREGIDCGLRWHARYSGHASEAALYCEGVRAAVFEGYPYGYLAPFGPAVDKVVMENKKSDSDTRITITTPLADLSQYGRFKHAGQMWRCMGVKLAGAGQLELLLTNPIDMDSEQYAVRPLRSAT